MKAQTPSTQLRFLFGFNALLFLMLVGAVFWQTRHDSKPVIEVDSHADNALYFKQQLANNIASTRSSPVESTENIQHEQRYVFDSHNRVISISRENTEHVNTVSSNSEKAHINSDSATELANKLIGIGARKADAIVEYRQQNGPFSNIDQLGEVDGIGAKTLAKNRHLIELN